MNTMRRMAALVLASVLALSVFSVPAMARGEKYTEETTKDGWIRVINEGGATLGYSADSGVTLIADDGYAFKDLNKNGALDPYEDWRLDAETRAADLAGQMKTDYGQAAGLMMLSMDITAGTGELSDAAKALIDQGVRTFATAMSFASINDAVGYINRVQAYAESSKYGIPMESQAEPGTLVTSWPSSLSLAATFDPSVVAGMANSNAREYRALGITSINGPQIDLSTEPRWSRIRSTFGEDPQLGSDMAAVYVNALQSTYDEEGNDLGWGAESVNAFIKHFPGDGAAESGRESHNDFGAYNVMTGDNFYTQLLPFAAALNLEGKTEQASGVMSSYSITLDEKGDALGDERTGSGFNYYKITELLREEMGFKGATVTDYGIPDGRPYGVEDLTLTERFLLIIEAGNDKVGATTDHENLMAAIKLYEDKNGAEATQERLAESIQRLSLNMFRLGLFENAYCAAASAKETVGSKETIAASLDAQKKGLVMLKNADSLICERGDKPTVYISMKYDAGKPATEANDSSPGTAAVPASANLPIDIRTLSKYVNIITDTVNTPYSGPADEDGNPTMIAADIIPPSDEELAKCDFALVFISAPSTGTGFDSATSTYIPKSLQYRPYTANSLYVRKNSIGGNIITVEVQDTYGAQSIKTVENRSYFGKTVTASNESDLDKVLNIAAKAEHTVVVVSASGPMIFSEFEDKVDAIIMNFGGISDEVILEIVAGKTEPSGLLPIQMPANMDTVEMQYEDVPRDMECHVDSEGNTYDFSFGLDWDGVIQDERVTKYNVDPIEG